MMHHIDTPPCTLSPIAWQKNMTYSNPSATLDHIYLQVCCKYKLPITQKSFVHVHVDRHKTITAFLPHFHFNGHTLQSIGVAQRMVTYVQYFSLPSHRIVLYLWNWPHFSISDLCSGLSRRILGSALPLGKPIKANDMTPNNNNSLTTL